MIIKASNPSLQEEYSFLNIAHTSGVSVLYVQRAELFNRNFIQLEEYGNEKAEILPIGSKSLTAKTITLASATYTRYSHITNTKVYEQAFDKVYLYRASASGGTYTSAALSSITPDHPWTELNDTTGVSTDYGKLKFWDSVAASGSDFTDEFTYAGFTRITAKSIIDRAKAKANAENSTLVSNEDTWIDWLNDAIEEVAMKVNMKSLFTSTTFTANGSSTQTLPTNFFREALVKFGSNPPYRKRTLEEYYTASGNTGFFSITSTQLLLGSSPSSSTDLITLYYYKRPATIQYNTTDIDLEKHVTNALVLYMAAEYHARAKDWTSHDRMFAKYERALNDIQEANPMIFPESMPLIGATNRIFNNPLF